MIKKELNPEHGKRLNECLNSKKMSQKEFAEKSGYTKQYISYIVTGKKNISSESAEIFSNILQVRKEYLLCKDNYKTLEDMFSDELNNVKKEEDILRKAVQLMLQVFGISVGEPYVENWSGQEKTDHLCDNGIMLIHQLVHICIDDKEPLEIPYATLHDYVERIIEYAGFQAEKLKNNYESLKAKQMRLEDQRARLKEFYSSIADKPKKDIE